MTERPPIPAAVKRVVRQRCGYGCVVCGLPLFDYEHMLGYATTRGHAADEITLLCPQHHAEKTRGLLPVAAVQAADRAPVNVARGTTTPFGLPYAPTADAVIHVGSSVFHWSGPLFAAFVVDNEIVVGFARTESRLFLVMQAQDTDGRTVIEVRLNELTTITDMWDVQWVGQRLTLRAAPRDLFLVVRFQPPSAIYVERARLFFNGVPLTVDLEGRSSLGRTVISGSRFEVPVGLKLGQCPDFGGAAIAAPDPRGSPTV